LGYRFALLYGAIGVNAFVKIRDSVHGAANEKMIQNELLQMNTLFPILEKMGNSETVHTGATNLLAVALRLFAPLCGSNSRRSCRRRSDTACNVGCFVATDMRSGFRSGYLCLRSDILTDFLPF
jgi:hypothetical protein